MTAHGLSDGGMGRTKAASMRCSKWQAQEQTQTAARNLRSECPKGPTTEWCSMQTSMTTTCADHPHVRVLKIIATFESISKLQHLWLLTTESVDSAACHSPQMAKLCYSLSSF